MTRTTTIVAALLLAILTVRVYPLFAQDAVVIPAPAVDAAASDAASATLVLAGGCFWGVQGVFQHVKGVTSAVSGYAGGEKNTAKYDIVGTDTTGHAEAVQIIYNPKQVSLGRLLQIYFSVVHDPTELNRQGPDSGRQYRSAIFPLSAEQASVAKAYIAQLDQARVFRKRIATTIEPTHPFYAAEAYHQDFLTTHPTYPYIVINDLPKVAQLKKLYADRYQEKPVLVKAGM